MITGDQEKIRKINKSIVMNTLRLNAPISRARVANLTGLNRGTVSNIVNVLIEEGLVSEYEQEESKVGRPGISLGLRPDGGAVVGLEIGVDFITIVLTNFVAETLWETKVNISPSQPQTSIISQAEQLVEHALSIATEQRLRPLGIGIGLPGLINLNRGELIIAPNLNWRNIPLTTDVESAFPSPRLYRERSQPRSPGRVLLWSCAWRR